MKLKLQYDGYRFAKKSPDIYNPFSLLKCFNQKDINNYWFESGTPSFLIRQMERFHTDITTMDHVEAPATSFDRPTENMEDALPLLYQSGYITIKDYDRMSNSFILAIPNNEVRTGLVDGLIPATPLPSKGRGGHSPGWGVAHNNAQRSKMRLSEG